MRIYLAARYGRHREMQRMAADLRGLGHEVTSRWIQGNHDQTGMENPEEAARKRRGWADEDLSDLLAAECVISFTEHPEGQVAGRSRGGRHVEFGIALATGKRLMVVGYQENIFHYLPGVEFYEEWWCCRCELLLAATGRREGHD